MKKIIVVGAGILGASTAYQLAKMGAEVLVIDRKDKGQATHAAKGIICPWLSPRQNQAWYRMAKAGAHFYPSFIEELRKAGEKETGYAPVGALSIHHEKEKIEKIEKRVQERKQGAPEIGEISFLSEVQTAGMFPLLAKRYHSIHISGAARVDGEVLRDALVRSAQRMGAVFLTGDAKLQYHSKRVTGVTVSDECYAADEVIICAGVWADQLLEPLGIRFKVSVQKAQIVYVQVPAANDMDSWPAVMPPSKEYLLAYADKRIAIGATREDDIEGHDVRITAGGLQELLNKGLEMAPGLANSTFQEARVGLRPFTPGDVPVIGPLPGWDGIIAANGLGSSGLTMGPYMGLQLAKLALKMDVDINLEEYDIKKAADVH
ncbi:FAD-binding oxidoreductase [Bacillus spizizenii]|uniref:NAD(P)/FAD-dependent oxidoreductase n=1 Tax=Bacillus spizizenii TaxID=96241 RepID=UPI0005C9586B|nr:FAD-binding oxidoreductase [Bacillus spizizenii]MCY7832460.1 FAD-binding oxidoreductase [Bacillus spizizenii]MCY7971308.1 FAD-binding oxidoreductase [Bacillus spizizenii]MCY8108456.1 FAD-binding oxidoreductase [Bacillus spizizenii]MCY8304188.1 FAD-binding oxidoreductase [Bacillus spizizenii]MCY8659346.1 FAD-binding oxidoreductase [Bacillus spizizenii]